MIARVRNTDLVFIIPEIGAGIHRVNSGEAFQERKDKVFSPSLICQLCADKTLRWELFNPKKFDSGSCSSEEKSRRIDVSVSPEGGTISSDSGLLQHRSEFLEALPRIGQNAAV